MSTFKNITLSDELLSSFNISGQISSLSYKDELSADEIKGIGDKISSVISSYPISSHIGLSDYITTNEVTGIIDGIQTTSDNLTGLISCISQLSGKNTITTRAILSSDFGDNKICHSQVDGLNRVWIENMINGNLCGFSDISVVKIALSSYEQGVLNNTLSDNTLYVIDSDYMEAFGRQICSLTMGNTEETKFEGIAATKPYVDKNVKEIKDVLDKMDSRISSVISVYPTATESENGLMSKENYTKLSGIEDGANKYILPTALSDALGGIKIGFQKNGKNYPVELSDEKAYVNVPWENTTYSVLSNGLSIDSDNKISLKVGSNLTFDTEGKLSANEGRTYSAGRGLSLNEATGEFSTSAEYTTYDNVVSSLSDDGYVTSVDNERVWIENMINGNLSGYSDISVIKVPISSYEQGVLNNTLCNNTLYIIDSDYIDAYGQQICSLTMSDVEGKEYEGVAATKPYVDEIKDKIRDAVTQLSNEIFTKSVENIEIIDFVTSLSIFCETMKQI